MSATGLPPRRAGGAQKQNQSAGFRSSADKLFRVKRDTVLTFIFPALLSLKGQSYKFWIAINHQGFRVAFAYSWHLHLFGAQCFQGSRKPLTSHSFIARGRPQHTNFQGSHLTSSAQTSTPNMRRLLICGVSCGMIASCQAIPCPSWQHAFQAVEAREDFIDITVQKQLLFQFWSGSFPLVPYSLN